MSGLFPRLPHLLVFFVLLCALASGAHGQEFGADIVVSFDEAGTLSLAAVTSGQVDVYVVAYGLVEISGYEFLLAPTELPSFFLGKTPYGIAPLDFGDTYEVRAGTGGCVSSPMVMGADPSSWTLTKFQLGYFAGIGNDVYFCVSASPSSGASTPQFTICDEDATKYPFYPIPCWQDVPPSCAVANPTFPTGGGGILVKGGWCPVRSEVNSWGTLKAQYR